MYREARRDISRDTIDIQTIAFNILRIAITIGLTILGIPHRFEQPDTTLHLKIYMSRRSEKRRETKTSQKPPRKPWQLIEFSEWLICLSMLLLVVALPWYFGSVRWQSQYLLAWAGVGLGAIIAVHCIISIATKSRDVTVPWLAWLFFFLGTFAFVQSLPMFSWQGNESAPSSVHLQRWTLGLANAPSELKVNALPTLASKTETTSAITETTSAIEVPCDLKGVPESERRLAWSVEPLHTRGAAVSLFLCGLFVWIGRMVFSDSTKQLYLFVTLTLIGILIACVGIQGSVSYQSQNFLGLISGSSFATFVSKNSAGGFYNVCIAGCLGLLGWTLLNTQRSNKDTRYRFADKSLISKVRGFAEDSLADLNTAQITAVLCLICIVAALLISLCRGAAVSALGAIIVAAVIANARNRSRGSWVTAVAVATAMVACMVGFQIDDKAYDRLESLSEIDLEAEFTAGRTYIWSIAWKAMSFYGWLGSGLGTFHFAYLPFQEPSSQGWYYHAESLYAQCGVELGYFGLSLMCVAIIAIVSGLLRPTAKENWGVAFPSKLSGAYLVISQSLHSFVDFAIILPALFVPSCLLIGSVQGSLAKAKKAPTRKRSRSEANPISVPTPQKEVPWLRRGLLGIVVSVGGCLGIVSLVDSIRSLSAADAMLDWVKNEDKKSLEIQSSNRVRELASIWSSDDASLKENSIAMKAFADALLFEYRMNQMIASPPSGPWSQAWSNTSPVFFQLAMDREQDQMKKDQIIEMAGGVKAVDLLNKASNWYALGQTKSPLQWSLLWGRCLSNTTCDRMEIAKLLPASLLISKHNAQQLLATTILFRNQFDQTQYEAVLTQAMKSNPGSSGNCAKLIAMERTDAEVSIEMFPKRYDILQTIATQTFTKDRFPETYRKLWERAGELVALSTMTISRREVWLADSSIALGDANGEIKHLLAAKDNAPNDLKLNCRLANRLIDTLNESEAKKILRHLQRLYPNDSEVKALETRLSKS